MRGLKLNGIEVTELHDRSWFLWKYLKLFFRHWFLRGKYDAMIVGFPGFSVMPLARAVATAPVIFDAFVSYYDAHVFDRKTAKPGSTKAKYFYYLDKLACKLADRVLLETNTLIDFFVQTFCLPRQKFCRIFIGANDEIFRPFSAPTIHNSKFLILFWGYMTPQHGVEYILQAAKILGNQEIEFVLIGGGPEKPRMVELKDKLDLKNLQFIDTLSPHELAKYIQGAQVCLGVFGNVSRLKTVVTNKVYEALACGKPLITANEGAREVLSDGIHCLFCHPADPKDLADKILLLKNNKALRESLAARGYALYQEKFTPYALGAALKKVLEEIK